MQWEKREHGQLYGRDDKLISKLLHHEREGELPGWLALAFHFSLSLEKSVPFFMSFASDLSLACQPSHYSRLFTTTTATSTDPCVQ